MKEKEVEIRERILELLNEAPASMKDIRYWVMKEIDVNHRDVHKVIRDLVAEDKLESFMILSFGDYTQIDFQSMVYTRIYKLKNFFSKQSFFCEGCGFEYSDPALK